MPHLVESEACRPAALNLRSALNAYAVQGDGELDRDFKVEYAVTTGVEWVESELPQLFPALAVKYR
jgi:hypothetical protein